MPSTVILDAVPDAVTIFADFDPVFAVSHEEKSKWFTELCDAQEKIAAERCKSMVGTTQRVLIESKNDKTGLLSGRTDGNIIVDFSGNDSNIGNFADVEITSARNWILKGKLI